MTMTKDQIAATYQRASDVVNGFATVKTQQARDAVALAGVIAARDQEIENLQKQGAGLQLQVAGGASQPSATPFLDEIFGKPRSRQ